MQGSTGYRALRESVARALAASLLAAATSSGASGVSITSSGTPAYSVPIAVPPGIAGMVPALTLNYTGSGPNGPLGYGWSLQGASMITRCPGSLYSTGKVLPVTFGTVDRLCLDGQRLVQTNEGGVAVATSPSAAATLQDAAGRAEDGSYTEYRTETDSFSRVRAYGMANGATTNGPRYFKVWTKSGQILEFGAGPSSDANTNAVMTAAGQNVAVGWGISRISDTQGNYVDFKYNLRSVAWGSNAKAGNEWNLVEIQYTGNSGAANQPPSNKVVFEYADRPDTPGLAQDRSEAYHHGSKTVSVQRLAAVRTYINWAGPALGVTVSPGGVPITPPATAVKVKVVKLSYAAGANTGRSVNVGIQECVGSAETICMPATSFAYDPGTTTTYTASSAFASNMGTTPLTAVDGSLGVLVADFNGDGRSDLLRWSADPTQNKLYTSNGDGNFTLSTTFNLTATNEQLFAANGCYFSVVGDFNGDGFPDILRYAATTSASGAACTNPGTSTLYVNNGGNGSFTPTPLVGATLQRTISTTTALCGGGDHIVCTTTWTGGANFYLLDVDGDGILDIVTSQLRAGSSTAASGSVGAPTYTETCPSSICTHVYKGDGTGHFTDITPASMQAQTMFINPSSAYTVSEPAHVADINGDGLSDLVSMANATYGALGTTSWLSNGDGSFSPLAASALCGYPIDFNGDGRADCLTPGSDPSKNVLAVADGSSATPTVTNFNLTGTGQELAGATIGVVPADLDNDGRTDLIRWEDDPTKNVFYMSNGDGTFRTVTTNLNTANYALKKSDGTKDFVLGDFTGNGNVEILRMVSSPVNGSIASTNQLFVKTATAAPELLKTVTTGSGIAHQLTWVTLPNSSSGTIGPRFTPAPAASYPLINVIPPLSVVATVESGTGVGGATVKTEYAYNGLRVGLDGRGLLGFMKMTEQHVSPDNGKPTRLETSYLQDRGYVGSPGVVQSYDAGIGSGGHLLSETTSAYCDMTSTAALPMITTYGSTPTPCPSTALIQRPYLYQTVSEGWDIDALRTVLPVITTTNTYDNEGNPSRIVTATSGTTAGVPQTTTMTVNNTYAGEDISGDHWVLNQLQRATVNKVVTNSLPNVTTGAGTGSHAADRSGPTPGPNIPALLSIITSLLLSD